MNQQIKNLFACLSLRRRLLAPFVFLAMPLLQACNPFLAGISRTSPVTATAFPAAEPVPPVPAEESPARRYRDPAKSNFGTNVAGLIYYSGNAVFADMMKQTSGNSGRWDYNDGVNQGEAPLDVSGFPLTKAVTSVTGDYPSGEYQVSWDGSGTLRVDGAELSSVTVKIAEGIPHNTATLHHERRPGGFDTFWTTPPLTNLQVLAPTSEITPGSYFLKNFIDRLRPFSNLRFLDAQNVNSSSISNWSERTWPLRGSRVTSGGFAYEDIIAIGNLLVVDVWINIPVRATDDYVCRLARLLRYGEPGDDRNSTCDVNAAPAAVGFTTKLNRTSQVYLELSNELWGGIPVNRETVTKMITGELENTSLIGRKVLLDSTLPWSGDLNKKTSQYVKVLEKRTADIFRAVYTVDKTQIKFVLAIQAVWSDGSTAGFEFIKSVYGPLSNYFDFIGVAPYIETLEDWNVDSVDAVFNDINRFALNRASASWNNVSRWLNENVVFASRYGLPIIAYEGGQGLKGAYRSEFKVAAQHDPRMRTTYEQFFALWDQIVGHSHLFVHYTDVSGEGQWGSWGLLNQGGDLGSVKFDAVLALSQTPGDANLDGIVDEEDCKIIRRNFGKTWAWWREGDFNHDATINADDTAILNANIKTGICLL